MKAVTVESVKLYFSEIVNHWRKFCYLLDVFTEILLWRGRLRVQEGPEGPQRQRRRTPRVGPKGSLQLGLSPSGQPSPRCNPDRRERDDAWHEGE